MMDEAAMEQHVQQTIDALEKRAAECCAAAKTPRKCFAAVGAVAAPTTRQTRKRTARRPPRRQVKARPRRERPNGRLAVPMKPKRVTREAVLATIAGSAGVMAGDVATKLNVPIANVYYHLQQLVKVGTLTCGGDKKYRRAIVPKVGNYVG